MARHSAAAQGNQSLLWKIHKLRPGLSVQLSCLDCPNAANVRVLYDLQQSRIYPAISKNPKKWLEFIFHKEISTHFRFFSTLLRPFTNAPTAFDPPGREGRE
jgi:hypothetical protein